MNHAPLHIDVDQIDAVFCNYAVAAFLSEAVVLFESPEVAVPCLLGAELKALACREVLDGVELSGRVCTPFGYVHDGSHLNDVVGTPVPAADGLADHVELVGNFLVLLDEDGLCCIVEGNVVVACNCNADVDLTGCEGFAKDRLVNAFAFLHCTGFILFRSAHALVPLVVCADLELVGLGDGNVADLPDVVVSVLEVEVGIPVGSVDGTDEGPCLRLCGRRRYIAAALVEVCDTIGRIEEYGVGTGLVHNHVSTALGHDDRGLECVFAAAKVVVCPLVIAAELEFVFLERNVSCLPDLRILGDLLHVDVGVPVKDCRTDDTPGLCTFHDVQILILAQVDVGDVAGSGGLEGGEAGLNDVGNQGLVVDG